MALVLDLLRHGEAGPAGTQGDRARTLTAAGKRSVRLLAAHLREHGWLPERAFASPYVRALETGRLVLAEAGLELAIDALDELEPESDPQAVLDALKREGEGSGHVLLVGHQPLLGRLATHCVGAPIGLAPGQLVRVELERVARAVTGRVVLTLKF